MRGFQGEERGCGVDSASVCVSGGELFAISIATASCDCGALKLDDFGEGVKEGVLDDFAEGGGAG